MNAAEEQEEPEVKVVAIDDTLRIWIGGPAMRTTETSGASQEGA